MHASDAESTQMVETRNELIRARQIELAEVVDRHDDLTREIFQLEHFRTLLKYDPKVAKLDNSIDFQKYKEHHHPLQTPIEGDGPGRRTRGLRAAQSVALLGLPVHQMRSPDLKGKGKARAEQSKAGIGRHPSIKNRRSLSPEVKDSRRGPGRPPGRRKTIGYMQQTTQPTSPFSSMLHEKLRRGPGRPPGNHRASQLHHSRDIRSPTSSHTSLSKGLRRVRAASVDGMPPPSVSESFTHATDTDSNRESSEEPVLSLKREAGPDFTSSGSLPKRIKLTVRKPIASITQPQQRAPGPKFDNSVRAFLRSYASLDESGSPLSQQQLDADAFEEAKLRQKILVFQRTGQFVPRPEDNEDDGDASHRKPSPYDIVVKDAIAEGRRRLVANLAGISSESAKVMEDHWSYLTSVESKRRDAEEKRIRSLAKATFKLVLEEWRKAAYHVQEKYELAQRAEERRLGKLQLDAILDQSGQILEAQQENMVRVRSESQELDSDDETDVEATDEDEQTDGEDDVQTARSASLGADTIMLIGNHTLQGQRHDREVNPDDDKEEEEEEEEEEAIVDDPSHPEDPLLQSPGRRLLSETLCTSPVPPEDDQMVKVRFAEHNFGSEPSSILPTGSVPRSSSSPTMELDDVLGSFDNYASNHAMPFDDNEIIEGRPEVNANLQPRNPGKDRNSNCAIGVNGQPGEFSKSAAPNGGSELAPDVTMTLNGGPTANGINGNRDGHSPTTESYASDQEEDGNRSPDHVPQRLKGFAVAPVQWDPDSKVMAPLLLRGTLRPYQQTGLEWLAALHRNDMNGILADEMGLGKTIQTISLLAHLACDRGIWGPHLIIVPTSVLLNWEMEFKKFLPGFRTLSYHGATKRRKELRQGWNNKYAFNVCITSYTLATRDAHIFRRKAWYYMILDEAHMIKNFKSQRWNTLLLFKSFRRLLLTGTPLQNNLTELWSLLQFLMSGASFVNLKEFHEWFSNPLEKAIESGKVMDNEIQEKVNKLHTVLRPYILRRLKRHVERELPNKYEHLVMCRLSKRQRHLYDEFMERAQTRDDLSSGVYQKIANVLMQLRKVCNHPDLFEVRPIVTSFAIPFARSALVDYEITDFLIRRKLLSSLDASNELSLRASDLCFTDCTTSQLIARETSRLDGSLYLPRPEIPAEPPPPVDTLTIDGLRRRLGYDHHMDMVHRWDVIYQVNRIRCNRMPLYGSDTLAFFGRMTSHLKPLSAIDQRKPESTDINLTVAHLIKSHEDRAEQMADVIDRFTFATPAVTVLDLPQLVLPNANGALSELSPDADRLFHQAAVKQQIALPDLSLLHYDCGKLQELQRLLKDRKAGGHRVLIFTQMTKILDILEMFLNFHGYLYLRLDGATKIEDRQYITERFNSDARVFAFIASSRSGGVGINLTGADTVIFYDSDFNPQMDKQCEDRAHRIGQVRDVHIYRFVSQHTVEEALLRKANQKRSLDDIVIQKGAFDWRTLFNEDGPGNNEALVRALGEFEDSEDAHAAAVAAREEANLEGDDRADFAEATASRTGYSAEQPLDHNVTDVGIEHNEEEDDDDDDGTVVGFMLRTVKRDWNDYFSMWRL